jgi:hypothetical protein
MRLPRAALAAGLSIVALVLPPPVEAQTPQKLRFQASFPSSSLIFENFALCPSHRLSLWLFYCPRGSLPVNGCGTCRVTLEYRIRARHAKHLLQSLHL